MSRFRPTSIIPGCLEISGENMPVTQDDTVRVDLIAQAHGSEDVVNVFQFQKQDAGTITDAVTITDFLAIMRVIAEIIDALVKTVVIWERIKIRNMTTGLLVGDGSFSPVIPGVSTTDPGAMGVAAVMSFPTNVSRVTMRKFFGPLAEGTIGSTGLLGSNPGTVQLATLATYLTADIVETGATWRFGYLSPKTGNFQIPLAAIIALEPGYQRRRKRGVGA